MAHPSDSAGSDNTIERAYALALRSGAARASLTRYFRRRVNDAAEVDDLVQEVFLRLVVRGEAEAVDHVGGYIFQTAASVLADRYRRRSVRHADRHVLFDTDTHGEADVDAEQILLGREQLRAAMAVLMTLPERTRAVFVLKRLEGLRYSAIAAQLGISVSAVEKHMVRAVQHLMAEMGDR